MSAMRLVTSIGITAPFSAISGALMRIPAFSAALVAPMFFSASAMAFASKAALFQSAAKAAEGRSTPAASAHASAPPLALPLRINLRNGFIV